MPGCEIIAQPTSVDSPHSRASAVTAIFMPYRYAKRINSTREATASTILATSWLDCKDSAPRKARTSATAPNSHQATALNAHL